MLAIVLIIVLIMVLINVLAIVLIIQGRHSAHQGALVESIAVSLFSNPNYSETSKLVYALVLKFITFVTTVFAIVVIIELSL